MGRSAGKYKKRESNPSSKSSKTDFYNEDDDMMDDEIDAFHKQRDIIPLDIDKDAIDESDEDNEHPVYDLEDDDEEDEEEDDDDYNDGDVAKMSRQLKYLKAKMGGVDDEMHDEADENEKERSVWSRHKPVYYKNDNQDSSDEDEGEVMRLQKKKAEGLTLEDFGLEDDTEATFEEINTKVKPTARIDSDKEEVDGTRIAFEKIKRDLNALTKEEQMDVVYSSAPELVGLLSELNEALEELDNKVNPLLSKIIVERGKKGEMNYMETKKLLLLSYCQAITFYLLLKSEGQPVCDHPVISRLVDIKALLDKMKELDGNLPSDLEVLVSKCGGTGAKESLNTEDGPFDTDCPPNDDPSMVIINTQGAESNAATESAELNSPKDDKKNKLKRKFQDNQVGRQSMEMLKMRASLEEKLKQKGLFSSLAQKNESSKKRLRPVNGQLATLGDYDDEVMDPVGGSHMMSNGNAGMAHSKKFSQLVTKVNKAKVISGDDDLPKRDDVGERRRKHELRVLAGAGIKSAEDDDNDVEEDEESAGHTSDDGGADANGGETDSDLEFYKQVEKKHSEKVATKQNKYSRPQLVTSLPEKTADDEKRQITYQIEKNRGLTRHRNKQGKNPRKKYRTKHQDAVKRRKGQVQEIKKPSGPYGGEATGINAARSRSIRFKN
ncbi:unnamed protein product [Cuscuta epithymum]|uniref:Sas10 C-terminal domain-containing protein n=1 Tax=Cuscuta epithymum TaxID=186058 RepID=A0AAV0EDY3_9ASTE|nr:unnamed protein product [Cuscuta epithymum]